MVLTRYALLLLLCGCAGVQGIPMAPSAPTFSPVEDAPITIGQPGYVGHEPERSPHKRMLNQTPEMMREPGLWAGDVPRAALDTPPSILGIEIPGAAPSDADIDEVAICTRFADEALYENPQVVLIHRRMSPSDQRCAVLRLFLECIHAPAQANERAAQIKKHAEKAFDVACAERISNIEDWVSDALVAMAKHTMPRDRGGPHGGH